MRLHTQIVGPAIDGNPIDCIHILNLDDDYPEEPWAIVCPKGDPSNPIDPTDEEIVSLGPLFCAAPDMLAVLEELLALGNIRDALDFFSKVQAVIHTDVRSAIAKAKGES